MHYVRRLQHPVDFGEFCSQCRTLSSDTSDRAAQILFGLQDFLLFADTLALISPQCWYFSGDIIITHKIFWTIIIYIITLYFSASHLFCLEYNAF